jgi:hypothetical protein
MDRDISCRKEEQQPTAANVKGGNRHHCMYPFVAGLENAPPRSWFWMIGHICMHVVIEHGMKLRNNQRFMRLKQ